MGAGALHRLELERNALAAACSLMPHTLVAEGLTLNFSQASVRRRRSRTSPLTD